MKNMTMSRLLYNSLESLKACLLNCSECYKMVESRKEIMGENNYPIPFRYSSLNKIMLIGIAPGRLRFDRNTSFKDEYAFKMGSGEFINSAFKELNVDLDILYVTNIIKCTTPKDNNFLEEDLDRCVNNFLKKEIRLINPKIIILLGRKSEEFYLKYFNTNYHYLYHPSSIYRNGHVTYEKFKNKLKNILSLEKII